MAYEETNVFARILRGELPAHKIYETERILAFMDVMPRGAGHALVVPKGAARNILDVDPDDLSVLIQAVRKVSQAAMIAFKADGITVQQFNESAGGQVVFHLHFHVIPRFSDVPLKPHTGQMEDPAVLAAHAEKLRQAIASLD